MAAFSEKGGLKSGSGKRKAVADKAVLTSSGNTKTADVKAGRPNCLDEERLAELLNVYYTYPYSYRRIADMFGVSRMTVWRAVQTSQSLVATR